MSRSVPEWVGKSDDVDVPPHVRLRVFDRDKGICRICSNKIVAGERWVCDHIIALINGGANREENLQTIHTRCDKTKTARDVAEKSRTYRKRSKHLGLKPKPKRRWGYGKGDPLKKKVTGEVVPRTKS